MLGHSSVSWKSKKQPIVSKSSTKAEYQALSSAASEITWFVRLLTDLGMTNLQPLFCDNKSAIHLAHNPIMHERTTHIAIDCHFTREKVLEGLLHLVFVPTHQQLAALFTKSLPSTQFFLSCPNLVSTLPHVCGGMLNILYMQHNIRLVDASHRISATLLHLTSHLYNNLLLHIVASSSCIIVDVLYIYKYSFLSL